jgi:hypothetical protein
MNRRVTPSIVFAMTIVCAIALGRPAWSQDQPLSRSIVSDTNPQHKAHISFTVKAEQAYRAQVQENQAPGLAGPTNAPIFVQRRSRHAESEQLPDFLAAAKQPQHVPGGVPGRGRELF